MNSHCFRLPYRLIVIFLIFTNSLEVYSSQDQAKNLAHLLDTRDDGFKDLEMEMTMTISTPSGESAKRKLHLYVLEVLSGGDKSLMEFDFPADVRGTSLLTHPNFSGDDQQWLYLPAIKRVKRISSRNKSGSFVGSEFSFEDLTDKNIEDYSFSLGESENCAINIEVEEKFQTNNLKCHVLERRSTKNLSSYSKEVLYFDSEEFRLSKVEYYDIRGDLLKVFTADKFKIFDGKYWRPMFAIMENMKTGKITRLDYDSIDFDVGISARKLSRSALGR